MAEAAAAALLSCPAAPAGWCRQQCRRPAHASTRGARCRASPREQATAPASSSSTPLDVLRNDFSFLEESTGLDLLAPLEAVVGTHDEVRVCLARTGRASGAADDVQHAVCRLLPISVPCISACHVKQPALLPLTVLLYPHCHRWWLC